MTTTTGDPNLDLDHQQIYERTRVYQALEGAATLDRQLSADLLNLLVELSAKVDVLWRERYPKQPAPPDAYLRQIEQWAADGTIPPEALAGEIPVGPMGPPWMVTEMPAVPEEYTKAYIDGPGVKVRPPKSGDALKHP